MGRLAFDLLCTTRYWSLAISHHAELLFNEKYTKDETRKCPQQLVGSLTDYSAKRAVLTFR